MCACQHSNMKTTKLGRWIVHDMSCSPTLLQVKRPNVHLANIATVYRRQVCSVVSGVPVCITSFCFLAQGLILISSRTVLCVTELYSIVLRLLVLVNRIRYDVIHFCRMRTLRRFSVTTNSRRCLKALVLQFCI